ncbi:MAG: type II secretion system F family protein [Candidatus Gracilibacteria bacterium]|nr:type II secretion system F family protein [Candidatus Gracilibacteria bacterium]
MEIKARRGGNYKGRSDIILFSVISKKDIWSYINKMAIFINSGIDIKTALSIVIKQTKNPELKDIVTEMKLNIDHGVTIAETMQQHPKVFDPLITALIGVGEKTGQLGRILSELDRNLLDSIELKGKVKGSLIYPVILLTLTFGVVVFMMVFIVPKISETFAKANVDLPALTQMIVGISNFFINDYLKLIIIVVLLVIGIRLFKKTNTGRIVFGYSALNIPIFGKIVKQSNVIYFINSFTILLDSGILLLESLKIASDVVPNLIYKKEVIRIKNEVELGLPISKSLGLNIDYEESLYLNKLFNEEFAYVVNTGEETGTLSVSLKRIGYNYDVELKRKISNLSSMLEPVIIVLVGALVGTIVVGVMLPFFEMGKVAKNI